MLHACLPARRVLDGSTTLKSLQEEKRGQMQPIEAGQLILSTSTVQFSHGHLDVASSGVQDECGSSTLATRSEGVFSPHINTSTTKKKKKGGSQDGFKKPLCFRLFVFSRISQLLHVWFASQRKQKVQTKRNMASSHCMGSEDARGLL